MNIILCIFGAAFLCIQVNGVDIDSIKDFYKNELTKKSTRAQEDIDNLKTLITYDNSYFNPIAKEQYDLVSTFEFEKERQLKWVYYNEYDDAVENHRPQSVFACLIEAHNAAIDQIIPILQAHTVLIIDSSFLLSSKITGFKRDATTVSGEEQDIIATYGQKLDDCLDEFCLQHVSTEITTSYGNLSKQIIDISGNVESVLNSLLEPIQLSTTTSLEKIEPIANEGVENLKQCQHNA